jgi:hypothetical protein
MSWGFLFEVLERMGFSQLFRRWVSILLQTASTKVLVNGEPGPRIQYVRGLRQGDPTSPMLFVIGLEVLTATIAKAVQLQLFHHLAGISPLQRISVYADDVVLFVRPAENELRAIREILGIFGEASGLHVNYRKTAATLIRGEEGDEERVKEILGCEIARFPIRYLGLKLALRPLTRSEWQPALDMIANLMPAW